MARLIAGLQLGMRNMVEVRPRDFSMVSRKPAASLDDVIGVLSVLAEPGVVPSGGSLAATELAGAREHACGTGVCGEELVWRAYTVALVFYKAALEDGKAMVTLMNAGSPLVPVVVLARALVEVASQAWWLTEPEIGRVARVQRLQAIRYRSACEAERAAEADGASPSEYGRYGETKDQVEQDAFTLGLPMPTRTGSRYECGTECLPTPTCGVRGMFADVDVPSVYNLYSGYAHGELYALQHGSNDANQEDIKGAVSVVSYALNQAGGHLATLYGLREGRTTVSSETDTM